MSENDQLLESPAKLKKEGGGVKRGKKKLSGLLISYLIAAAIFAVLVILVTINGGQWDEDITRAINDYTPLDRLGQFVDPSTFEFDEAFKDGQVNIGQLPSEALLLFALIFQFIIIGQYSKQKKISEKTFMEKNPGIKKEIEEAGARKDLEALNSIKKKIAQESHVRLPEIAKMFKYMWFILFSGILILIFAQGIFKPLWGRERPNDLLTNFEVWWQAGPVGGGESFMSGHTMQATLVLTIPLILRGARRKWLAPVVAIPCVMYVVMVAIARMASNDHWLSDTVFGAFTGTSLILLSYFFFMDIPGQERVWQRRMIYGSYTEGYHLILEGKDILKENASEGIEKISEGLGLFQESWEQVEKLKKFGRDYSDFAMRIDDLRKRFGKLIQEFHELPEKSGPTYDDYLMKWSYVF
ncbi:MAG: phosphatase PAP2 family protein [Promethearchaeota archaeon]